MTFSEALAPARAGSMRVWLGFALSGGVLAGALSFVPGAQHATLTVLVVAAAIVIAVGIVDDVRIGVAATVALLPLQYAGRLFGGPILAQQAVLAVALLAWAARMVSKGRTSRPVATPIDWGIGLLVLAGLWSLLGTSDVAKTLGDTARLLPLWAFAALIIATTREERDVDRLLAIVVITGVLASLLAIAQAIDPTLAIGTIHLQRQPGGVLARPAAFYLDPNFLAGFLTCGTLAGATKVVTSQRLRDAWLWAIGSAVCLGATLLTFSRSGWVGIAIGLLVVVALAPRGRRRWLIASALVIVAVAMPLAPESVTKRVTSVFGNVQNEGSLSTRWGMLASSADMIRDHPVFGTGLGAFDAAYPPYRRPGALAYVTHPHQLPVGIVVQTGAMGVAALMVLVWGLATSLWRRRALGWAPQDTAIWAVLIALLAESLFQYYLYFDYLWLFLALAAARAIAAKSAPQGRTTTQQRDIAVTTS